MSVPRRVVVTGMGTVSAAGLGGRDMVRALHARRDSALRTVRGFDTSALPCHLAGEVDDEALDALFDRDAARRLSRICRLTVAACRLAVEDAGVDAGPSLGLVVGTEYGDFRSSGEFATGFLKRGPSGLSPMLFPGTVMNAMGAAASIAIGVKGPTVTVNQVTVSSEIALARGAALIVHGRAEAVLAGGVDELCGPVYQRLAHELGVLSPMRRPDGQREGVEGCRPYAPDHNGPALGEGATFLVLEDHELARARGATILAELRAARWGNIPVAPYAAPVARRDPRSVLRASLADEENRASAGFQSLKASYVRAIQVHVEQRWYEPPGLAAGLSCTIFVSQIPGGEVVGMRFGPCNGNAAVRQSIENAVRNASPLPAPPEPRLFEREVKLVFTPKESRR